MPTIELTPPITDAHLGLLRAAGSVLIEQRAATATTSIPLSEYRGRVSFGGVLWPAWALGEASPLAVAKRGITAQCSHLPGGTEHKVPDELMHYLRTQPEAVADLMLAIEGYLHLSSRWDHLQTEQAAARAAEARGEC